LRATPFALGEFLGEGLGAGQGAANRLVGTDRQVPDEILGDAVGKGVEVPRPQAATKR